MSEQQSELARNPSWSQGEIVGRPLWPFLGSVGTLIITVGSLRQSHLPPITLALTPLAFIAAIFGLAVALERCQSVKWDQNGFKVFFLGRPLQIVQWLDVVALDKERRFWLKDGKRARFPSMFTTGVRAGALLELAAIIHGSLRYQAPVAFSHLPGTRYDALKKSSTMETKNNIWRRVVADLAPTNTRGWDSAPTAGVYVYKTHGSKTQTTLIVLGWVGIFVVKDAVKDAIFHPGWAAVVEALLIFGSALIVIPAMVVYQKLISRSGIKMEDTVEVSSDGVRIWHEGKATPWLQYPRRVTQRKSSWFPGGTYQTWSNGEEQHAIDPRFLVPLQDDLPPEFAYAATEGGGWMTPDSKPVAQHKPPDPLPEKGQ